LEHIGLADAESSDGLGVRTQRNEVLCNVSLVFGTFKEPATCRLGIRDRLLSGEGFASNDKERSFAIAFPEGLCNMGSIDVGYKVGLEIAFRVWLEGLSHHDRTKIRTTNTNINDGVDSFSCVALPVAASDRFGKLLHVVEDALNLIDTSFGDVEVIKVAKSNVKNSAIFRGVNVLAGKHLVTIFLNFGFFDQRQEGIENRLSDEVFGKIDEHGNIGAAG